MSCNHIAIIGNSAASILNFRGSLISLLTGRGVRISAFAPDYDDASRADVRALGAEPVDFFLDRTGTRIIKDLVNTFYLWRLLSKLNPDCVLTYFVKPNIYGTLSAWLSGVPHRFAMVEGLGFVFTDKSSQSSLKKKVLQKITIFLYRFSMSKALKVIFLNEDDILFFVKNNIINSSKSYNLGGIGVDLEYFSSNAPTHEPIVFLLVARLLREKGIAEFIAASKQVKLRHPSAQFVIIGGTDPNPGGFPEAEVRQADADGFIKWPGAVADVRPWIARSSVFVLPSYREGLPRSTQEAMAMSRPIITTDAPGCRDTVTHGVNGLIVPVGSVSRLVDAMLWFAEHPSAITEMGRESRFLAEKKFNVHDKDQELFNIIS